MNSDLSTALAREYTRIYDDLLAAADRLEVLRRMPDEEEGVNANATAALHAVRFAVMSLHPAVPTTPPPGFRQSDARLLELAAHWREAAFGLD
ncbi:hypothetical protein [Streptomyces griseoluteus]|uniref:hypothetical protein n=1 Tax=Streptomyces griseoluteus TaxID=29306 RepID=UPI0036E41F8A